MKKLVLFVALSLVAASYVSAQQWVTTQNNSLAVYPDTTKVGLGTGAPTEKLHLVEGAIRLGRKVVPAPLVPTDWVNPCIKFGNGENIAIGLFGTFSSTTLSFYAPKFAFITGKVGIGTSVPQYKLDVNGTIHANEIIVGTVSGADFVFQPTYSLRPLTEVSEYISTYQHLPEIPSAAEMEANGVNLNEFPIQLLQKIEELTLYILQQEERIKQLEQQLK